MFLQKALFLALPVLATANPVFFTQEMTESHLQTYTKAEVAAIQDDLAAIRKITFRDLEAAESPSYVATAGGPGARKTTILEHFLEENSGYAYIDPDPRGLKLMAGTYIAQSLNAAEVIRYDSFQEALKAGYDKWRGGSNYIALTLLEEAFSNSYSVAHGATSTGGHVSSFYDRLHERGYDVTLLLCFTSDDFRWNAIEYRNTVQHFYQSSPEDAVMKGHLFPTRLPVYFEKADALYLYWSEDLFIPESLAAVLRNGELEIFDMSAYEKIQAKYAEDREEHNLDLSWEELVNSYKNRL